MKDQFPVEICNAKKTKLLTAILMACGASVLYTGTAFPVTLSLSGNNTVGMPTSKAPSPITPVFATITNFTSYTGPFPYRTGTFYVGQTGQYSGTLNTPLLANGFYFLRGAFSPSTGTPTTPLANFIVFRQAINNTTISNIAFNANQQYSYLQIFSTGNTPFTFTLTGPGCISFDVNQCADYVTTGNVDPNDPAVAAGNALSALNAAGNATGDLQTVLNTLNGYTPGQLNTEVRRLVPSTHHANRTSAFGASELGLNNVSLRLATMRGDQLADAGQFNQNRAAAGDQSMARFLAERFRFLWATGNRRFFQQL